MEIELPGHPHPIRTAAALSSFDDPWRPRIIGDVNGRQIKLVKRDGAFDWRSHEHEDEAFFVPEGRLRKEFRDGLQTLGPGDLNVAPRGVEHRPVAEPLCLVMLFEPASTLNTGGVEAARTVRVLDRIG